LGLQERRDQQKEKNQWVDIESKAIFYPKEGTPSEMHWDGRESTRAMNELHIIE